MSHPGYLTRSDKILIAVAVLVLAPFATVGFPYLTLVFVMVPLTAIFFCVGRRISRVHREPPDNPGGASRETEEMSKM